MIGCGPYDDFNQFELGLCADVLEIDMAWPRFPDEVVIGKFDRLADGLDRLDIFPRRFTDALSGYFDVANAVSVNLRRNRCPG